MQPGECPQENNDERNPAEIARYGHHLRVDEIQNEGSDQGTGQQHSHESRKVYLSEQVVRAQADENDQRNTEGQSISP